MTRIALHPAPFLQDLKGYKVSFFSGDLVAALSVALMALPQAVAYAFLADLPPSAGIWAAVFGTIFTAAFGGSRYLVSGTTNIVAILIQSGTSEILYTFYRGLEGAQKEMLALNILMQIVLFVGLFQLLAGMSRLGRLTQFTSRSVVHGYIGGAALAIAVTQLFPFFGLREQVGYHPIYQQGWYFLTTFSSAHIPTLLLAILSLALLIALYRISDRIPAPAIVFALAAAAVAILNLAPAGAKSLFETLNGEQVERIALLKDLGPLLTDLPRISFPFFELRITAKVVPLAFAITLLTVLEATSIGRRYTRPKEPPYNDNQEIYGLGVSNLLCSFLGVMPSSGSFSRTALNVTSGAKTRFAALFSGLLVLVLVFLFGFFVGRIPICALSALMLFTAYSMVNFKHLFICLRATKSDSVVVAVTLLSSLFFTLDVALYVGIAVSIVLYLKRAADPELVEYAFNNVGKLRPLEADDERPDPEISIIQPEGELFFGASDLLQIKLRFLFEEESLRVVILQLLNTRGIDASVCLAIRHVYRYFQATDRHLMVSGVSDEVWKVLERSGVLEILGEENCFRANEQLPSEPTRAAYARAKQKQDIH